MMLLCSRLLMMIYNGKITLPKMYPSIARSWYPAPFFQPNVWCKSPERAIDLKIRITLLFFQDHCHLGGHCSRWPKCCLFFLVKDLRQILAYGKCFPVIIFKKKALTVIFKVKMFFLIKLIHCGVPASVALVSWMINFQFLKDIVCCALILFCPKS